jgi:hypothetical protein
VSTLSLTVQTVADEIKKAFWSREPYRHIELRLNVRSDSETYQRVRLEVLLPEAIVIDVPSGATWHPSHRHELEGQDFLAWDTFGGFGREANGGYYLRPEGQMAELLIVSLKSTSDSVVMFWRLFEREQDDPAEPFHHLALEFTHYVSQL